jgi:hypothetical protein
MKAIKLLLALLFLSISVFLLIFAYSNDVVKSEKSINYVFNENNVISLGDKDEHILHFLQISDLHISKLIDPSRVSDFRTFCSEVVDIVRPKVVRINCF